MISNIISYYTSFYNNKPISFTLVTLFGSSYPSKFVNLVFTIPNYSAYLFISPRNRYLAVTLLVILKWLFNNCTTKVQIPSLPPFNIIACSNSSTVKLVYAFNSALAFGIDSTNIGTSTRSFKSANYSIVKMAINFVNS